MAGEKYSFAEMASFYRLQERPVDDAISIIRKNVKLHGPRLFQRAVNAVAPHKPVDRGTYRRSLQVDDIPTGAALYNSAPYAAIIEWGRRVGARPPPLKVLIAWAARKHLVRGARASFATEDQYRQLVSLAFAIQRAMKRRGLPARRIIEKVSERLFTIVSAALRGDLAKEAAKKVE